MTVGDAAAAAPTSTGRETPTSKTVSLLQANRSAKEEDLRQIQKEIINAFTCAYKTCINREKQCWVDDSGLHYALLTHHIKTWSILQQ